jgi:putative membrane protein
MNDCSSRQRCLAALLLAAGTLVAGCATVGVPLYGPEASAMGAPVGPKPERGAATPDGLTLAERPFMSQAAKRAMYDLEVSRLAVDRAIDPRVRTYAQKLATYSVQANSELGHLMRARGVARPAALPADKATKLHRLAALRPSPDFDLGYVRVVGVEDHQATIAMYERARRECRDPDLQAWIDKTLPLLRGQLAAARNLAGSLAG